jgi:hypothetical protein
LSRSQKDAFGTLAIDNFDNIRNSQWQMLLVP